MPESTSSPAPEGGGFLPAARGLAAPLGSVEQPNPRCRTSQALSSSNLQMFDQSKGKGILLLQNSFFLEKMKDAMKYINLEKLASAPVAHEPFEYLIVKEFVKGENKESLLADFPQIQKPGVFSLSELKYGPSFSSFIEELESHALTEILQEKFNIDLEGKPILTTVRGWCSKDRDGNIHTDSEWKLVTLLVYLNEEWEPQGGRLRLLRSKNINDYAAEVPPEWGSLIAFKRSDNSFHGHLPFEGRRRVVMLNWVTSEEKLKQELGRHNFSSLFKKIVPFTIKRN
ncbi:2OG-Fe(II) oxygenase [Candidatus Methylacidiphilum infernorum]|uniref:2OG-Fe(II) oxygenase n=2 Tax=Candidatus Methylacidiphilum infernorum TaxID=511746 RepID=A0ABX7PUN5_9BACT|nr:2OG-Fe(II) oxygenase [Candidatus Methylacidiphilum infernorum]